VKTLTILLAGLAALCAVPAVAETVSVPVSFAGLDLTSTAGQDALNNRVNQAVRTICGTPDLRDLAAVSASHKCTTATLAQARPRVAIAIASSQPSVQLATAR
jgi:UrcA family protein